MPPRGTIAAGKTGIALAASPVPPLAAAVETGIAVAASPVPPLETPQPAETDSSAAPPPAAMPEAVQAKEGDRDSSAAGGVAPEKPQYPLSSRPGASSKYQGVTFHSKTKKWQASGPLGHKYLGLFSTAEEAAHARWEFVQTQSGSAAAASPAPLAPPPEAKRARKTAQPTAEAEAAPVEGPGEQAETTKVEQAAPTVQPKELGSDRTAAGDVAPKKPQYPLRSRLDGLSKYQGVTFHAGTKKWQAFAEGHKYLGLHSTEDEAAHARWEFLQASKGGQQAESPTAATSVAQLLAGRRSAAASAPSPPPRAEKRPGQEAGAVARASSQEPDCKRSMAHFFSAGSKGASSSQHASAGQPAQSTIAKPPAGSLFFRQPATAKQHAAEQTPAAPRCPSGHQLKREVVPYDGGCDICDASLPTGCVASRCSTCLYELCSKCCRLPEAPARPAATVPPAAVKGPAPESSAKRQRRVATLQQVGDERTPEDQARMGQLDAATLEEEAMMPRWLRTFHVWMLARGRQEKTALTYVRQIRLAYEEDRKGPATMAAQAYWQLARTTPRNIRGGHVLSSSVSVWAEFFGDRAGSEALEPAPDAAVYQIRSREALQQSRLREASVGMVAATPEKNSSSEGGSTLTPEKLARPRGAADGADEGKAQAFGGAPAAGKALADAATVLQRISIQFGPRILQAVEVVPSPRAAEDDNSASNAGKFGLPSEMELTPEVGGIAVGAIEECN